MMFLPRPAAVNFLKSTKVREVQPRPNFSYNFSNYNYQRLASLQEGEERRKWEERERRGRGYPDCEEDSDDDIDSLFMSDDEFDKGRLPGKS